MKNSKKTFILIEVVLGILVMILAAVMILGNTKEDLEKISVVVQDSDDTQWAAFRYGLRMAAQDQGVEMFVVGTESMMTVEEQEAVIEQELNNGADAVIVQPVSGEGEAEMLQRINSRRRDSVSSDCGAGQLCNGRSAGRRTPGRLCRQPERENPGYRIGGRGHRGLKEPKKGF